MSYKLVKERTNDKVYEITEGYGKGTTTTSKKFPVIGGPCDGLEMTRLDLVIAGLWAEYHAFNRAGGGRRNEVPKQVFVHRSDLGC